MIWQVKGTAMNLWPNPIYVILITWGLTGLDFCLGQSSPGPSCAATDFTPFQSFWRNDYLWLNATVQANAAINECGCLAVFQTALQKKYEASDASGCGTDLDKDCLNQHTSGLDQHQEAFEFARIHLKEVSAALNDTSQTGGLNCCLNGGPDKSGNCRQLALDFVNKHMTLPPPSKYIGTQSYGGGVTITNNSASLN